LARDVLLGISRQTMRGRLRSIGISVTQTVGFDDGDES